jgi:hypothetical protein
MDDVRNLVVQDDTRKDIGLVTVTGDDQKSHWVTLPDGSRRSAYFSRKVDEIAFDTLVAFEALPLLKVSYRPISRFLYEYSYHVVFVMIGFWLASLIFGVLVGIGTFHGSIEPVLSHPAGFWTATILGLGTPASTIMFCVFHFVGNKRYSEMSEEDYIGRNTMHDLMRKEDQAAEDEAMKERLAMQERARGQFFV